MLQENDPKTASLGSTESEGGLTNSTALSKPNETDFLDPDSSASTLEQPEAPLPMVALPLSDEEMRQVSIELGLTTWSPSKMKALGKMGDFLREQGAVRVSTGDYVFSNVVRHELITECRERLSKTKDPEVYALLLDQLNTLLGAKDAASKMLIEAMKVGLIKDTESDTGPKLPPRGAQIVMIQNNTTVEPSQKNQ